MCDKGDLTQCTELNKHAKKLNETSNPSKHGNYYVTLNEILKDTSDLHPLLLSSMGNNVKYKDFITRIKTVQNINPLITSNGETLDQVYTNQQDLDDLMTFSNIKAAYCLHLKNKNDNYSIPSIGTGYKEDYTDDEPDENGYSPLMKSIVKKQFTLNKISNKFADNPFKKMDKTTKELNSEYYCNRFMPIYCQNVIEYIKNKMGGVCTQNDLLQFAPQCACFGTTNFELISTDKTVMDQLKKNSNYSAYISALKGNPRKCELAQCLGKYTLDNDSQNCPGNNIQICGVNLSMNESNIDARNNALINMTNNCNQIAANVAMNPDEQNPDKTSEQNSDKTSEQNSDKTPEQNSNKTSEQNSDKTPEQNSNKTPEQNSDKTPDTSNNIKSDTDNVKKPLQQTTENNKNNTTKDKKEKTNNTMLYIIIAIVAVIVVIVIIIIIVVASKKTNGGAPHIADFGNLIKSTKKYV